MKELNPSSLCRVPVIKQLDRWHEAYFFDQLKEKRMTLANQQPFEFKASSRLNDEVSREFKLVEEQFLLNKNRLFRDL